MLHQQAWNNTKATASVALVLTVVPIHNFSFDLKIFKWKCPLQNENGLALSKMNFQACIRSGINSSSALDLAPLQEFLI